MVTVLEKAIFEKEYLKYTPRFLARVYGQGLYGVTKDDEKEKRNLQIAVNRGYEPRKILFAQKQGEEYISMLEAQQSDKSVFFNFPVEVIRCIARLRFEEKFGPLSKLDKKP